MNIARKLNDIEVITNNFAIAIKTKNNLNILQCHEKLTKIIISMEQDIKHRNGENLGEFQLNMILGECLKHNYSDAYDLLQFFIIHKFFIKHLQLA